MGICEDAWPLILAPLFSPHAQVGVKLKNPARGTLDDRVRCCRDGRDCSRRRV